MLKIPHLRDYLRLHYKSCAPQFDWSELLKIKSSLFWVNKFNAWQMESEISPKPFPFEVIAKHPNKLDVLVVRTDRHTLVVRSLSIIGKLLVHFNFI